MFRSIGFLELVVILCVAGSLYFLPTIVAIVRKKTNLLAIFLVNFLLGWSVIGWIVALVWAASTERVDQTRSGQPVPLVQTQARWCSSCGKYSQADSRFCAHCGSQVQ